jgi:hypothetical protein
MVYFLTMANRCLLKIFNNLVTLLGFGFVGGLLAFLFSALAFKPLSPAWSFIIGAGIAVIAYIILQQKNKKQYSDALFPTPRASTCMSALLRNGPAAHNQRIAGRHALRQGAKRSLPTMNARSPGQA